MCGFGLWSASDRSTFLKDRGGSSGQEHPSSFSLAKVSFKYKYICTKWNMVLGRETFVEAEALLTACAHNHIHAVTASP